MKTVRIEVNGESLAATVSARTQLAELLRDHFALTGTHLGCEQGVCGACTVVADGIPIRSCISYAHAYDGARILTVEGLGDDPVGKELREAFSKHHALQCGFCTPGMLLTARDIVQRGVATDRDTVRRELSGNLCRCTGYMGLVSAVCEVAGTHPQPSPESHQSRLDDPIVQPAARPARPPFTGFEIAPEFTLEGVSASAQAVVADDADGWTSFTRHVGIRHPVTRVWTLLTDLRRVAECIPGVRITRVEGDHFAGESSIKFGPVTAIFDGQGNRRLDPTRRSGSISASGVDANGQTSLEARFEFELEDVNSAKETIDGSAEDEPYAGLAIGIRFRIQGHLAQFNRPELVESFADILLRQFADNCERVLSGQQAANRDGLSGLGLLFKVIAMKLFKGRTRS